MAPRAHHARQQRQARRRGAHGDLIGWLGLGLAVAIALGVTETHRLAAVPRTSERDPRVVETSAVQLAVLRARLAFREASTQPRSATPATRSALAPTSAHAPTPVSSTPSTAFQPAPVVRPDAAVSRTRARTRRTTVAHDASPAAATPIPTAAIETTRWSGALSFPADIETSYAFTSAAGEVSAGASWAGGSSLEVTLACPGAIRRASATSPVRLSLEQLAGGCSITIAEPVGSAQSASYVVWVSRPTRSVPS